MYMKCIFCR